MEQALKCKAYLTEIVEFALTYRAEDFSIITDKLVVALKVLTLHLQIYVIHIYVLRNRIQKVYVVTLFLDHKQML